MVTVNRDTISKRIDPSHGLFPPSDQVGSDGCIIYAELHETDSNKARLVLARAEYFITSPRLGILRQRRDETVSVVIQLAKLADLASEASRIFRRLVTSRAFPKP